MLLSMLTLSFICNDIDCIVSAVDTVTMMHPSSILSYHKRTITIDMATLKKTNATYYAGQATNPHQGQGQGQAQKVNVYCQEEPHQQAMMAPPAPMPGMVGVHPVQAATVMQPEAQAGCSGKWKCIIAFIVIVVLFILIFLFWVKILECCDWDFCKSKCDKDGDRNGNKKDCKRIIGWAFVIAIVTLIFFFFLFWACGCNQ